MLEFIIWDCGCFSVYATASGSRGAFYASRSTCNGVSITVRVAPKGVLGTICVTLRGCWPEIAGWSFDPASGKSPGGVAVGRGGPAGGRLMKTCRAHHATV